MRTINNIIFCILILLTIPAPVLGNHNNDFPYKFLIGATGSNMQIQIGESWVNIHFSEVSNKESLKALLGLRWEVLYLNSEGKIFLKGQKLDSYQIDINGKTKVYNFVLNGWYIVCPFEFYIKPKDWLPGDEFEIGEKKALDSTCFSYPVAADLGKYCKNR